MMMLLGFVETATSRRDSGERTDDLHVFHPLAGRTVASSKLRVRYRGDMHLTICLADGTLMLTPEWMPWPAAAGVEIRPAPRLSSTGLCDLRAISTRF